MAAKIKIACVGKLKEPWLSQACNQYLKRLTHYTDAQVLEVRDRPDDDPRAIQTEGEQLLRHIDRQDYVIALAVEGQPLSSPALASLLQNKFDQGRTVTLLIGGSNGLAPELLARADKKLSFSAFTFPHGLMRVILLEQLYRACTINANHPYHK